MKKLFGIIIALTGLWLTPANAGCPAGSTCVQFNGTYPYAATGGASSRDDADRWADWKNVKDYGATGNCSTDDTAAIQAAFNALDANAPLDAGTVYFPANPTGGCYKVTHPIMILAHGANEYESYHIKGDGNASWIAGSGINGFVLDGEYQGTVVAATAMTGSPSGATFNGQIDQYGTLTINSTTSGTMAIGDTITGTSVPNLGGNGTVVINKWSGTQGAAGSTYQVANYNAIAGVKIIENLKISNSSTNAYTGCVRTPSAVGIVIRSLNLSCFIGVVGATGQDSSIPIAYNMEIDNIVMTGQGQIPLTPGSTGIIVGGNSTIRNPDITAMDCGVQMYGVDNSVFGGRFEVNNAGLILKGPTYCRQTTAQAFGESGGVAAGFSMESNFIGIDIEVGSQMTFSNIHILGFQGASWYQGTVFGSSGSPISWTASPSGATGTGYGTAAGVFTISTATSGTLALGDAISGSGVQTGTVPKTLLSGTQGQAGSTYQLYSTPQYDVFIQGSATLASTFLDMNMGCNCWGATVSIGDATNNTYTTFIDSIAGNTPGNGYTGAAWSIPAHPNAARFVNSNNQVPLYTFSNLSSVAAWNSGTTYTVGQFVFATDGLNYTATNAASNLNKNPANGANPSFWTAGGGNATTGDRFVIKDAATGNCSDSACNWGANITGGGGALQREVEWNGSNWTVVGK